MAEFNWSNNTAFVLRSDINDTVTAVPVETNTATIQPQFVLMREGSSEKILVTSIGTDGIGPVFTVTRGYDGSTAEAHTTGVSFFVVIDPTGMESLRAENMVLKGDLASIPASPLDGMMYIATNSGTISFADGNSWIPVGPLMKCQPPSVVWGDFTLVAGGGLEPNVLSNNGSIFLRPEFGAAGPVWTRKIKPLQYTTGTYSVRYMGHINNRYNTTSSFGILVYDDVSGKAFVWLEDIDDTFVVRRSRIQRRTAPGTLETTYLNPVPVPYGYNVKRIRVNIVAKTLDFQISTNMISWATVFTVSFDGICTSFTHVGFQMKHGGHNFNAYRTNAYLFDFYEEQH